MHKLVLVDGHNLLFQMFFGLPARIAGPDGQAIQGTVGFVGGLRKIVRMTAPTHVLVVFDGERGGERSGIFADYKANRTDYSAVPDADNPFSQLPDIYRALSWAGIRHIETDGMEADDLIAGCARRREGETVIVSSDTDFYQLADEGVTVLRYRGEQSVFYGPAEILAKYGVEPRYFADYKALVGDGSDNIPGIPRVGPKTAAELIRRYGGAEEILKNAGDIRQAQVRTALLAHRERLALNLRLIRLGGAAELPFAWDELAFDGAAGLSTARVLAGIGLR